jgi:glycerophosphoryl diester phosphodiesterase
MRGHPYRFMTKWLSLNLIPIFDFKCRPLIMGNGGGDSKSACENTFEATEAGLKAGMSAVQLDISLSADGTPFLWRDHLPGAHTIHLLPQKLIPTLVGQLNKFVNLTYTSRKINSMSAVGENGKIVACPPT